MKLSSYFFLQKSKAWQNQITKKKKKVKQIEQLNVISSLNLTHSFISEAVEWDGTICQRLW